MKFQDKVKGHMAKYKINQLGVTEPGFWKKNNKPYPHILPEEKRVLNLLSGYRNDLWNFIKDQDIHLHKDFHHLNSSQAACLNFFYPMIADNQVHLLLELLQLDHEEIEQFAFEKIISKKEGTNFDFYMQLKSGKQIFFEIKYTEDGFGKATDTETYRRKYKDVYRERLTGKIQNPDDEYQTLITNYQLLRNISYVDVQRKDSLIIICPRDNTKLYQEFENVKSDVIAPDLHDKIKLITWETMILELKCKLDHIGNVPSRFREHYRMFEEKYIVV